MKKVDRHQMKTKETSNSKKKSVLCIVSYCFVMFYIPKCFCE